MTKPTNQPDWRKAGRCGNGACVEVAKVGDDQYLIRDSKNPTVHLTFSYEEWATFVAGVKDDYFG